MNNPSIAGDPPNGGYTGEIETPFGIGETPFRAGEMNNPGLRGDPQTPGLGDGHTGGVGNMDGAGLWAGVIETPGNIPCPGIR